MMRNKRIVQQMNTSITGMSNAVKLIKESPASFQRQKKFFANKLFSALLQAREFYYCYINLQTYDTYEYRSAIEDFKEDFETLFSKYPNIEYIDNPETFLLDFESVIDDVTEAWSIIHRILMREEMPTYSNWTISLSSAAVDRNRKELYCKDRIEKVWEYINIPNREINLVMFNANFQRSTLLDMIIPSWWMYGGPEKKNIGTVHAFFHTEIKAEQTMIDMINLVPKVDIKRLKTDLKNVKVTARSADITVYFPCDTANGDELLRTDTSGILLSSEIEKGLVKALNTVRSGGVFIAFVPAFILHDEVRIALLKKLKDIHIINVEKKQRRPKMDMCMLVGVRTQFSVASDFDDESINRMNQYLLNKEVRTSQTFTYPEVTLPAEYKKLTEFKGAKLSDDVIKELCKENTLLGELQKRTLETHSITDKRPLLPFTSGQLGLVLVSGELDGIIKEKNGHSHVIKGMTAKHTYHTDSTDENILNSAVTTNIVRIALFDKEGNYKQLV